MGKAIKKQHHEKEKEKKNFIASMVILVIMVLSIAGFALMTGGGNTNSDNLPSEIPFQQFEDPNSGQTFWGAIKNSEQFIFENIDGYENNSEMKKLSDSIKSQPSINIYVDENFQSSDSLYLIEKALRGINIPSQRIINTSCEQGTLIFTNNNTYEGNCMVFNPSLGEEYKQADILIYHLIQ